MLKSTLTHPEILAGLARSGHGSQILIADGNFPFNTRTNPAAQLVYLNLAPGVIGAVDVLKAVCSVVPIESALVMAPPVSGDYAVSRPDIWDEFESVIRDDNGPVPFDSVGRFNFYESCRSPDVSMVIATGEQRIFANLLLTIGVVRTGN